MNAAPYYAGIVYSSMKRRETELGSNCIRGTPRLPTASLVISTGARRPSGGVEKSPGGGGVE